MDSDSVLLNGTGKLDDSPTSDELIKISGTFFFTRMLPVHFATPAKWSKSGMGYSFLKPATLISPPPVTLTVPSEPAFISAFIGEPSQLARRPLDSTLLAVNLIRPFRSVSGGIPLPMTT